MDKTSGGHSSKRKIAATSLLVLAVLLPAIMAAPAAGGQTGQALVLKARVDDKCVPLPATLTVPAGKTAYNFSMGEFKPGKSCKDGSVPDQKGITIKNAKGDAIYIWSQYKQAKPYEKNGPLGSLELAPGDYALTAAGGAGAEVEVSYALK